VQGPGPDDPRVLDTMAVEGQKQVARGKTSGGHEVAGARRGAGREVAAASLRAKNLAGEQLHRDGSMFGVAGRKNIPRSRRSDQLIEPPAKRIRTARFSRLHAP
jgi:hypothetical protein